MTAFEKTSLIKAVKTFRKFLIPLQNENDRRRKLERNEDGKDYLVYLDSVIQQGRWYLNSDIHVRYLCFCTEFIQNILGEESNRLHYNLFFQRRNVNGDERKITLSFATAIM